MKNNVTELVCILDRSGSMKGLESDTVGGYNALIGKQKKEDGECFVTTVLFNARCTILHDRVPVGEIEPMTAEDYVPGGRTALLDAIGATIRHISNIHRYARPEDVPSHTIFVITTDGLENASRSYGSDEVKNMIERKKEKYGWEFLFLAANIDAVKTAEHIGISQNRAANYRADSDGVQAMYHVSEKAVCQYRRSDRIADDWAAELETAAKRG